MGNHALRYFLAFLLLLIAPSSYGAIGGAISGQGNAGGAAGISSIRISTNGTAITSGTNVNFIAGTGVTIRGTNDSPNNKIDVYLEAATASATNAIAFLNGSGTNLTVYGSLTAVADLHTWGAFIAVPVTNHANALTVVTNWYQRRPSATNYTLTFSGTAADGTRMQFDAINTAATNYTITFPSSLSATVPGNPAITTMLIRSNSVTEIRWIRKSGAWHVAATTPSGVVFDENENISTVGTVSAAGANITNNIAYITANLTPVSAATNHWADFTFAARTFLMTNAVWLEAVTNAPAANIAKPYVLTGRNYSGGALRVGAAAGFRRIGTNNVSIANNQNFMLTVWPDGTGGSATTNFIVQILVADSP